MMPMLVALAGGLGAGVRYVLDGWITDRGRAGVPVATLVINVLGSFLLGVVVGLVAAGGPADLRAVAGVGFCGGFTTFSTASVELLQLVRSDRPRAAAVLALTMLVLSIAAVWCGLLFAGALPTLVE